MTTATQGRHGEVRLTDLAHSYGATPALHGISLEAAPGECLALLGPSGCGKSTTLRLLAGLERPDRGTVMVSGQDVTRVPAHRRDVHTVFQSYALFPHLSVGDNVAFPLRQRGVARAEVAERVAGALAKVRLGHVSARRVTQLSGGQQQRVALARAVVDLPSVLLLDEPLSALDRSLRQAMQVEMRLLQQDLGVTTILVTHDQEEALSLADRIAVMSHGRLEQVGTAEQIYDEPATLAVARFVGEHNEIRGVCDGHGLLRHRSVTVASARATPDGGCVALIRPEHVKVERVAADAPPPPRTGPARNALTGAVRGVSVAGNSSVVLVEGQGLSLVARVPRDGRRVPTLSDPVVCSWDPAHVLVFTDPEE